MAVTPTDPLYADQWYLARLGGIETVWEDYTGSSVSVGVYDDGIQYTHPDLDGNYDASLHVTVNGSPVDPMPVDGPHGTSVAGIIAAEADGRGTVGVAYEASLTGVNIFSGPASTVRGFRTALDQLGTFDVTNHSWGYNQEFVPDAGISSEAARFETSLVTGRGGLGTISVKAAGNEQTNANSEAINASRALIVVGAYDDEGDASYYSNYGANLLVSAPSNGGTRGQTTTDLRGNAGYASGNYTDDFGGTSGASPVVAGVVALMLEADAGLGWRDVATILAYSAHEVGSGVGSPPTADEEHRWFYNGADDWNGGGLHFSEDYGFGGVNAHDAVRLAEAWHLFADARTSANEGSLTATASPTALPDTTTTGVSFQITETGFTAESVSLALDVEHSYLTDLEITLVSPGGTTVSLYDGESGTRIANGGWSWTFGANAFRGEDPRGIWTLAISDTVSADAGTLNAAELTIYGRDDDADDDVHHVTDEFSIAVARDPGRATIEDAAGTDWLDGAALTANARVDLGSGSALLDGVRATIAGIEHALTGDGSDRLLGDGGGNRLFGMRGDDNISGRGGNDVVCGGKGDDILRGAGGDDTLRGADGIDTLLGGNDADDLSGGRGDDRLLGGKQDDRAEGDAGDDHVAGGKGNDWVGGGSGSDALFGEEGHDSLHGGGASDTVDGGGGRDELFGDGGADTLMGGTGNDRCDGGAGSDVIVGGKGRDILTGGAGSDLCVFDDGWANDLWVDFEDGVDMLDFRTNSSVNSLADLVIDVKGASARVTELADPANHVVIKAAAGLIDAADFLF